MELCLSRVHVGAVQGGSNAPVTARGRTVTILRARVTSRNLPPAQSNRQLLFILFILFISSLFFSFFFFVRKDKLQRRVWSRNALHFKFTYAFLGAFILLCVFKRLFKMPRLIILTLLYSCTFYSYCFYLKAAVLTSSTSLRSHDGVKFYQRPRAGKT